MNEDDYVMEEPPVPVAMHKPKAAGKKAGATVAAAGGLQPLPGPAAKGAGKGKGKGGNPRDGKVKKGKDGEAASFVPGDAAAPAAGAFDPAEICEMVDLWWEMDGGDTFVVKVMAKEKMKDGKVRDKEIWARWPKEAVKMYIRKVLKEAGRYIAPERRKGSDEVISELDEVLLWARVHRCVDEVVPALAGFKSGIVRLHDGREVVIRRAAQLIEAVKGEWGTIRKLIEGLLDDEGGIRQSDYFHAWCQVSYRSLRFGSPGSYKPGHALVIAGPGNCGKSRLQVNIITALLGGRTGDPTAFLSGDDSYNSDLIGSEHLMMEELLTNSWSAADRVNLSEAIKRMVANENKRLRLMRTDPITVQPFWRLTISMNNDPDKMRAFPMLTPDFRDKVVMLLAHKRPLPMPTTTDEDQAAFNAQIAKEMPAYIFWLMNEFVIPAELKTDAQGNDLTRFGFGSFQHPSLSDALNEETPAAQLWRLICQADIAKVMGNGVRDVERKLWELRYPHNHSGKKNRGGEWVNTPNLWFGTAEDLEELLCGHREGWWSSVARPASRLMAKGSLGAMLQRLKEDTDKVTNHRVEKFRGWMIEAPDEYLPKGPEKVDVVPADDGGGAAAGDGDGAVDPAAAAGG